MAHAQQQILDALQALLIAGATAAAGRVFVDRVDPLQANELPAILIEEGDNGEQVETVMLGGHERRELNVVINCVLAASSTAAADARAFGLAAEKLVYPNAALQLLAKFGSRLTESRLVMIGDGDRLLAARVQTWRIAYLVNPTAPDVIL